MLRGLTSALLLSASRGALGESIGAPQEKVTLYKVTGEECGQATLDAKYGTYAIKFAGLKEGSCAREGYSVADGSQTLKVPVLGDITISKFKKPSLGQSIEAPQTDITLYKVSGEECGQATLDAKYESYAVTFAGLKEGTCASQGYSVADGSQTLGVPVLPDITIAKFKKPSVGESIEAPQTDATLYKVSGEECGQATLDAKYKTYAIKFAGLKEGTCASQGYSVADGTQTLGVPVLGDITISKFKKPSVGQSIEAPQTDVTLYKVSGEECGQATLDAKYETYAVKFAGLKEGTCASQGYSVADGSQTLGVPVLGDITIAKFKKPTVGEGSDATHNAVTLYKVSDDDCGQATLDAKYETYAIKFAGLTEGTCASQGYSVADGSQTLKVPVLGDITIAKFKKPAMLAPLIV